MIANDGVNLHVGEVDVVLIVVFYLFILSLSFFFPIHHYTTPETNGEPEDFVRRTVPSPTFPDPLITHPSAATAGQRGIAFNWLKAWLQMPMQLFMPSLGMLTTLLVTWMFLESLEMENFMTKRKM